jgi:hypothetical protein
MNSKPKFLTQNIKRSIKPVKKKIKKIENLNPKPKELRNLNPKPKEINICNSKPKILTLNQASKAQFDKLKINDSN